MRDRYKAIFLDRDGTLSMRSPQWSLARDKAMGELLGVSDFRLAPELGEEVFYRLFDTPGRERVNNLAHEEAFWIEWYRLIIEDLGVKQGSAAIAGEMHKRFPFHEMMQPYPETVGVLEELKARGYPMGVISDTFPSLEKSLQAMGIAHYFRSFTASSVVGHMKPDPRIFRAATESLGVTAEESIFVDDCLEEADGAREHGFTSFHLIREMDGPDWDNRKIDNLERVVEFVRTQE